MVDDGGVRNTVDGEVAGSVVQAGTIQQVVLHQPEQRSMLLIPRQLPPAVRDFTGRDDQLVALDALLSANGMDGGATAISVLDGAAGVGKTSLAVRWAHQVQGRFPDGTLFVNLRGYGPSAPLDPVLVLAAFLRDLGVPEQRIPSELDALASMYRSLLAARRVLVLLDNASSSNQVRPLLPGSPGCVVLVTSRTRLTGLIVAEAATPVTVDLFAPAEAEILVRGIVGSDRAADEPDAIAALIRLCARLPLALRIAATRIVARRHTSVAEVVEDIRHDQDRLDTLSSTGDENSAVQTVFDWSYTRLPPEQARVFRRLGLHPGPEFGVHAAAAVAGVDLAMAYSQLEALADVHLIESVGRKRYRFHDLLHAYAAHRAGLDDTREDRQYARNIGFTWYARMATAADRLVFPGLPCIDIEMDPVGDEAALADRSQALAWLNTEQVNLMAALRSAAHHRAHGPAICLAATARFLTFRERALWHVRFEAESLGLLAARASRNRAAEALLLAMRGDTLSDLGRLAEAEADFASELTLGRELHDLARQRAALNGLGFVRLRQGRYADARSYYLQALPIARSAGGGRGEAVVECNLSKISARLGEYQQALLHAERELVLRRQAADRVGEAYALHNAAVAWLGLGDHGTGLDLANQAIAVNTTLDGTERHTALVLETAATALQHAGDLTGAAQRLEEAGRTLAVLGDPRADELRTKAVELQDRATGADRG